ncbi:cytochrome C [Polaromonas sp.]|uniref:cytochrome C n=1 Tax=Polaromonas sp. TaxID=1869339 RepID=UPI0035698FCD
MKVTLITRVALAASILAIAAGNSMAQDVTYRNQIAPMWKAHCIACHGAQSPERSDFLLDEKGYTAKSQGPRMDTYERFIAFVAWPDTGALMRRLDDGRSPYAGGKPGNMYERLGASEQERAANLKIIKAWVGEGAWNLNRWSKRGDVPAVAKEQLDKIKLAY